MSNVLIRRHKSGVVKGYPLPNDFPNIVEFFMAHAAWLHALREENDEATKKLIAGIRKEQDSMVLQYLSGILHIRKEYGAFLTKGIQSVNTHILEGGVLF